MMGLTIMHLTMMSLTVSRVAGEPPLLVQGSRPSFQGLIMIDVTIMILTIMSLTRSLTGTFPTCTKSACELVRVY